MKKIIRLTIIGTGAELGAGVIDDPELNRTIIRQIENDFLQSSMYLEDGTDFCLSNYTDILTIYGPSTSGATVLLEQTTDIDKEEYDRDYEELFSSAIDETEINEFISSYPGLEKFDLSIYSKDSLLFFNQKIEKRIHYPVLFELSEHEELDLSNVYIGSMDVDMIAPGEIIEDFLYIPKDKAMEYMKEYLKEQYDQELSFGEILTDIYYDAPELKAKIRAHHLIPNEDTEGKGYYENDYIRVMDLDNNILFENENY